MYVTDLIMKNNNNVHKLMHKAINFRKMLWNFEQESFSTHGSNNSMKAIV